MAKTLRESLAGRSFQISHSESLELIARILGCRNWQTLSAARLDGGGERLPVPAAEDPGDQLQAFRVADLEGAFGQGLGQGLGHGLGVAEITHGMSLCKSERAVSGLALLTRSLAQRVQGERRYIRLTRDGRKQPAVSAEQKTAPRCASLSISGPLTG